MEFAFFGIAIEIDPDPDPDCDTDFQWLLTCYESDTRAAADLQVAAHEFA